MLKNKLSMAMTIVGAALVLGAAGDSDIGHLSFEGVVLKLIAGIIILGAGVIIRKCPLTKLKRERIF